VPQCWGKVKLLIRIREATKLYYKVNFEIILGRTSHTSSSSSSSSSWLPAKHGYSILVVMEISLMKFVEISIYSLQKSSD
jgi:hypothetical protein